MNEAFALWIKAQQTGMLTIAKREEFTPTQDAYFSKLETALKVYREFEQDQLAAMFDKRHFNNVERGVLRGARSAEAMNEVKGYDPSTGKVNFHEIMKEERE